MNVKAKLAEDLKTAMRAKDSVRLDTIRAVRAAITQREADSQQDLQDEAIFELIRGLRKQRVEAYDQYLAGGRQDLAEKEAQEKALLEGYLPQAPDESVVEATVRAAVQELGATTPKDMGKVMQLAKSRLAGVDGKLLSETVKRLLSAPS
jgi:uncharacterized protein YqeY